jgi:hypothetical protein
MNNKITIFCDGGLGNRLNVLIGGLFLCKKFNKDPIINWPQNNWCGCNFDDLYTFKCSNLNLPINELFQIAINENQHFILHENQTTLPIFYTHSNNFNQINSLLTTNANAIYYHNVIPSFINFSEQVFLLKTVNIQQNILKTVLTFCEINNITKNTIGLHIRRTDFPNQKPLSEVIDFVQKSSNHDFFVCSDDAEAEKELLKLSNVCSFNKKEYVQKFALGYWNSRITDNEGRAFNFNVNRNRQSVIEAFIDMLILSRTKIIKHVGSTFSDFAELYSHINIFDNDDFTR